MEVLLGKTLINGPSFIAMFEYRRVSMVNNKELFDQVSYTTDHSLYGWETRNSSKRPAIDLNKEPIGNMNTNSSIRLAPF